MEPMEPMDRREIINNMTFAISLNRHATWAHLKIDMETTKIVTARIYKFKKKKIWGMFKETQHINLPVFIFCVFFYLI